MGFKSDTEKILADLLNQNYDHQARTAEKNHLAAGFISVEQASEIIKATPGRKHRNAQHDQSRSPQLWIMEPEIEGVRWYIKGYFAEEQTWFISFHPTEY